MGNTLTEVKSNDELVDFLVSVDYIKSKKIEQVFRAVDRDLYLPHPHKDVYKDMAIKVKNCHLSSPSVYATVLENLDLRPGLSFLNIGSGTGYLSTMVGLLLGCSGVNHGIELCPDVAEFAKERVKRFMEASHKTDFSNFCEPIITVGNFFNLVDLEQKYDRVYCGGFVPKPYLSFLHQLVKQDGILIRAAEDSLVKSTSTRNAEPLLAVSFLQLITTEYKTPVRLNDVKPSRLQNICRSNIRSILRDNIEREKFRLKKKIKGVSPECFNRDNESLFDFDEGEYLVNDAIPRDMEVLLTSSLQRFLAKESHTKRIIGEDHYKGYLKQNQFSSSSKSEEDNFIASEKNVLIHPDLKAIEDPSLVSLDELSLHDEKPERYEAPLSASLLKNVAQAFLNRISKDDMKLQDSELMTANSADDHGRKSREDSANEITEMYYQNPSHTSSQQNRTQSFKKQLVKDHIKQQDSVLMTGIRARNCEMELRGKCFSPLWHQLPDFKNPSETPPPKHPVSFSELMNQKIQDLPLTQSLKDILM